MVAKDSPFKTIDDLVKAWKADPGSLSVGGGSSPGGPDHLLPMQLAQAVGIDPKKVNFVSYDGGGDLLPAILGNKVDFATSGAGEYRTRSRPATSGCWRPAARSASRASTPRR